MVSAEAILWDHQNNVIDRTQLPLPFHISGKGKPQGKPKKAQKRAMRGVSAQHHSHYLPPYLDNFLTSDTHTYFFAPGVIHAASPSVYRSAQDTQYVENGSVEWITPNVGIPVEDNRQTSKAIPCLFCSPSHLRP